MEWQDLLHKNTICFRLRASDKQDALRQLCHMLYVDGILAEEQTFLQAVLQREDCGPTGIGGMIALPHGCSPAVRRSRVAVARLARPIPWSSIDRQPVQMVLLFAVPSSQSEMQLRAMAALAQLLSQEEYRRRLLGCRTSRALFRLLAEMPVGALDARLRLVAVTACPAGVAHTYISRECLLQAALARRHSIKVETQGALGVENRLTAAEIRAADVVIIAADIEIEHPERFDGKRMVRVPVVTAIRCADSLLAQIEARLGCGGGAEP